MPTLPVLKLRKKHNGFLRLQRLRLVACHVKKSMKFLENAPVIVLMSLVLFTGCAKHHESTDQTDLIGSWQWVRTDGGIGNAIHDTPASTGKQVELHISAGNHYAIYTNGEITRQGTYQAVMRKCIHDHTPKRVLVFTNGAAEMMIEYKSNDTMAVSDDYHDGMGSLYIKK